MSISKRQNSQQKKQKKNKTKQNQTQLQIYKKKKYAVYPKIILITFQRLNTHI